MTRYTLSPLLALTLLAGCDAASPQRPPMRFEIEAHRQVAAAPVVSEAALLVSRPQALTAPASVPSPAKPVGGGGSGGGAPAAALPAIASDAFLVMADGRVVPVSDSDAVSLPEALTGRATHFAPGRVPATIELVPGLMLHPRATSLPAEPSGSATLRGSATPGAAIYYVAPGRRAFPATTADAKGGFALEVPLDAAEGGVVVAKSGDQLALSAVSLAPAAEVAIAPMALSAPLAFEAPLPAPPPGLAIKGASLVAVPTETTTPFRVPLAALTPAVTPPIYDLPGFELVHAFSAESPDRLRGSVTGAAPGQAPEFLAPPDLAGLPQALTTGQSLRWPAVAGASLYTVKLTSSGQTAPIWEAAVTGPAVVLPAALKLPARAMVLQVDAWAAPDVTIYSVASLRALRVPATPSGPSGRHSWARRPLGPAAK